MFGEEALMGTNKVNVDSKSRIFVPSKTKVEKDDKLVLVCDRIDGTIRLYPFDVVSKKLELLSKRVEEAKNIQEKFIFLEKLKGYCKSLSNPMIVDSQKRITLGKDSGLKGELTLIGCYDHLLIEKPRKKR